jgi:HIRAN domain
LIALVGAKFRGADIVKLVASLPDGETLTLIRERENKFDPNAVQVWARGVHVGYLKESQNRAVATAMDAAITNWGPQYAKPAILKVTADRWPMVEIDE